MEKKTNEPGPRESMFESRRKSVGRILGIGALAGGCYAPGQWTRPVVNAVMLPAHAATSPAASLPLEDPCSITATCSSSEELDVTVNGFIDPPLPGVIVDLDVQFRDSGGTLGPVEDFGLAATIADGSYSASNSYSPIGVTGIRIIASLPDFPEAEPGICELDADEPGPHDFYSDFYFCDAL